MGEMYRYTGCGLDNIFLVNGFTVKESTRGQVVHIHNIEGLHRAIGEALVRQKRSLTGKELRFLRNELGLSQSNLADLLGESEQSVARREKAEKRLKRPSPQERLIRFMYDEHIGGNEKLSAFLHDLAELDEERIDDAWKLEEDGWRKAA